MKIEVGRVYLTMINTYLWVEEYNVYEDTFLCTERRRGGDYTNSWITRQVTIGSSHLHNGIKQGQLQDLPYKMRRR